MADLIYLVGLPGSGKSSYAEKLKLSGYTVYSSDSIREELYGDPSVQENPQKVFRILHSRIKSSLKKGENCVYDATNVKSKTRIGFLKEIGNIECYKTCVIIWAPVDICKERNSKRERVVPNEVIDRMWKNFETPYYFEGWDSIKIFPTIFTKGGFLYKFNSAFAASVEFFQENKNHDLTLGQHCLMASSFIDITNPTLKFSALYHDYGKIFTKTFYKKNGVLDKEAHYYNHQNVGAYEVLVLYNELSNSIDVLRMSALICYHMNPYFWKNSPRMESKNRVLWGEEFYNDILLLHEADRKSKSFNLGYSKMI